MTEPITEPMTEKQKMLAGLPYFGSDPALVAEHFRARTLMRRLQDTEAADSIARRAILHELLGQCGDGVVIRPPFFCDYGAHIRIGAHSFVNFGGVFLDVCPITIGDRVQIGPNVQLLTPDHPRNADERRTGIESGRPITIGDNVWIGGGAIILPGITIGADAIVGAGAVVTRNVAPGLTVGGNPARVLRPTAGR